jgi:hypothetical protein
MHKVPIIFFTAGVVVLIGGILLVRVIFSPQDGVMGGAAELIVDYKSDGSFIPQSLQVKEGSEVLIRVSADVEDEVHLHGYDKSADVAPGKTAEFRFVAAETGRFIIELENRSRELGVIEVYPK